MAVSLPFLDYSLSHQTEKFASETSENLVLDGMMSKESPMRFSLGKISSVSTRERETPRQTRGPQEGEEPLRPTGL